MGQAALPVLADDGLRSWLVKSPAFELREKEPSESRTGGALGLEWVPSLLV